MQKHKLILSFSLVGFICFSFADIVSAGIISLPRYQGSYGARSQSGGKDKVKVTCASKGGVEKGANQTCSGAISGVNNCYTSCSCNTGYKISGGSCVLKTCSDYGYQANDDTTKSCETKMPRSGLTCYSCTSCNTSTYKYACSGTGYASSQSGTSCNNLYAECSCASNYRWSGGKCVCDGNYKADSNGTCSLKTCSDYGYQANDDTTKDCSEETPRSGLTCYNCSACTGTLYDCSSISNNNGADTSSTSCGGKYAKCKCKTGYYWSSGSCEKSCTPSADENNCSYGTKSCSDNCNGTRNCCKSAAEYCTENGYKQQSCLSEQIADNCKADASYKKCEDNPDCNITPITIPSNASCSADNSCKKCTKWACNEGFTINSAGNGCEGICTPNLCSETEYPLLLKDFNNDENALEYAECTPSCSDEPIRYKITSCSSGYDVNETGSLCVEGCDEFEDNGSILYTDGSICTNFVEGKTPYAVILDTDRFIAIATGVYYNSVWGLNDPEAEPCDGVGAFIGDASNKSHSANLARDLEEVPNDDDGLSHTKFALTHRNTGVFKSAHALTRSDYMDIFGTKLGRELTNVYNVNVNPDFRMEDYFWYVPSYTEMSILSANIKSINSVLETLPGRKIGAGWYWISIETWGADGYAVRLSPDAGYDATPAYEYKTACTSLPFIPFIRYDKFIELIDKYKK